MTSSLKEAFDTEEIDEEYLNDDAEDPRDRLQLAKSKLSNAHKVIRSHEEKIQTLTEDRSTIKDRLQVQDNNRASTIFSSISLLKRQKAESQAAWKPVSRILAHARLFLCVFSGALLIVKSLNFRQKFEA